MSEPSNHRPPTPTIDAESARARAIAAGRWYSGYLATIGVASASWIVLLESVFPYGFPYALTTGAWAVFWALASWWAERHAVFPAGASRALNLATAVWFLSYLLIVGPLVRWQFGTALLPWVIASLLLSAPFFIAAARFRAQR